MVRLGYGALLISTLASAHLVNFDFVAPTGAGEATDGGQYVLQWVDSFDSTGQTRFQVYASRSGLSPLDPTLDAGLLITPSPILINDPLNLAIWNAAEVEPGCYQPFAVVFDPIEGASRRPAEGLVTVSPTDGGPIPVSLWFLTPASALPDDAGNLSLRLDVRSPDQSAAITLEWFDASLDGGLLAQGLPLAAGGGTLDYNLLLALLPKNGVFLIRATATAQAGSTCSVFWPGFVTRTAPDAGPPPMPDAGPSADAGMNPPPTSTTGCGCTSAPGPIPFALALLGLRLRRQRQE